jgi:hypothetical protein
VYKPRSKINLRKMRRIILLALLACIANLGFAQKKYSYIKFKTYNKYLNNYQEEKGLATVSFEFTNTGTGPLIITGANTSTSRINISFPKQPILPNKSEKITITYNPKKKKGKFARTITIMSNAINKIAILYIRGNIIPRPLSLEEKFPTKAGVLRFKKYRNRLFFNEVTDKQIKLDTVQILNYSDKETELSFRNIPNHIIITPENIKLKPKEIAKITIGVNGEIKKDYGYMYNRLKLYVNNKHSFKNDIIVNATITEDFTKLTPKELKNAPKIKFETTKFKFGTIKEGEKTSKDFIFKNEGKNELIIHKIIASCGCTAVFSKTKKIKGGQSAKIKITFNAKNKSGRQHKFINIITNDPKHHSVRLEVIGQVVSNKK